MDTANRVGNDHGWTGGDLARRVRRRRIALGLSRDEVAERARMDPVYVDRIESAPVALTGGDLMRLAGALDTTISELLGAQPQRPSGHGRAALHPVIDTMGEDECRRLIEPGGVGRVAFELAGRLNVVPVNFGMHDGAVVFRTSATTALGRYGARAVSFEIDRIDEGMHEGWSVVIAGIARHAGPRETDQLRKALDVDPWAGGDREVYIVIEPEQISGRRIRAW
ncbi:helix-turn-helix protein [Kribbella voronezhensis]|uniref:Helix-turn-helix protein n=1 Tax=Kribbella voronezhensis TaxID=2512212 RepID=A0A4R7SY08_9ACTN|nr:pyridoxamine 5'-phosphate oxidase family protein [Kribbella voronezhensis]TDU83809.1 helix-turn-helix protein [Kribbella voronezhensis]